ncbi:hydrogenase maturation protease [Methanolacinia petrolearia DSM 11571]|uniref:Hydrogenase maturation protease n=1 Tax=Methanolacinia petrolearia (strain DSM 11571 / OCM 486 / SEBR 4847) TaxID=679926 RepID=E1RHQ6_METP4|nr:coenzyme F420-reducing hydrogenase, FrhD protein [Methanolacinia petrolearia]ADN35365.1 hydrogenase maturation protease [Methanolacinia petrolearia DSM 11571]
MSDWYAENMIVGCGNPLQTDDGFGPAVIAELKKLSLPDNVKVLDAGLAGPHYLFTLMAQSDIPVKKMVILDIMNFGGEPGEITRVTPDVLSPGAYTDPHSWGLREPLQILAEKTDIVIFGCQPESIDISQMDNEADEAEFWVTESVRKAIPKAMRLALAEVGVDYGTTIASQGNLQRERAGS